MTLIVIEYMVRIFSLTFNYMNESNIFVFSWCSHNYEINGFVVTALTDLRLFVISFKKQHGLKNLIGQSWQNLVIIDKVKIVGNWLNQKPSNRDISLLNFKAIPYRKSLCELKPEKTADAFSDRFLNQNCFLIWF